MEKSLAINNSDSLLVCCCLDWIVCNLLILLAFIVPGEDFESILALVASSLGNTGPTIGNYGPTETWAGLNSGALLLTSILMWFGRLELLTAVILLHPHTWRSESKDQAPRGALARLKRMISREPHDESEQGPLG